jgi:ABC-type glycerol-3-phosphate transport system permease component
MGTLRSAPAPLWRAKGRREVPWLDLLTATLTNDQTARTMPVVLAAAQGGMGQWAWPRIAAVYVIVVTPGIIAFAFAQRLFFKGLMEGVLKA